MTVKPGLIMCYNSLRYCLLVVNDDGQHRVEKLCRHVENLPVIQGKTFLKCINKLENVKTGPGYP